MGGMIRAKFKCQSVTKALGWNRGPDQPVAPFLYTAKFVPVVGDSDENKRFWAATPSGQIELSSILPDAFEPGKSYYVDFTPAD